MEGAKCRVDFCRREYCITKVLECGHAICLKCLEIDQNLCSYCRKTLSKPLEDYPTNLDLLMINPSSNEKFHSEHQKIDSLIDIANLLLSRKKLFEKLFDRKMSYLEDFFVENINLIYSDLKSELVTSTDKEFSSLKDEVVVISEQKYSSLKNELETSSEEKFSSLKKELASSTDHKCSSLKKEFDKKIKNILTPHNNRIPKELEKFQKILILQDFESFDAAAREELKIAIDRQIELKQILHCNCLLKARMLHLIDHKSKKHFLCGLHLRIRNDQKICLGYLSENESWTYGEITCEKDFDHAEQEERLDIHCLSPTTFGSHASVVVSCQDIIECIVSKEDVLLFLTIGNQKLIFSLITDLKSETLQLIKLLIGEGGNTLRGIEVSVDEDYRAAKCEEEYQIFGVNTCEIFFPFTHNGAGDNAVINQYEVTEGNVILQYFNDRIRIHEVWDMKDNICYANVFGKLNENCYINFKMIIGNKVEDSGICFPLNRFKL